MLSRFSVKKPYTVLVGVVLIIVLGIVSFTKMSADLLPDINVNYAIVITPYQGASPEEVELAVSRPVESSMATISNVNNIQSVSSQNMSLVICEFKETANMDSVTIEMRENLDQINAYWPDEIGNPTILKLNPDMVAIMIAAIGSDELDRKELTEFVNRYVLPDIESIEGVATVTTTGEIEEAIHVIVEQDKIDKVNTDIQEALEATFDEANEKLKEAEEELDKGQEELEEGKKKTSEELAKGKSQLQAAQSEILKGEVQIDNQIVQLETQKSQLDTIEEMLVKIQGIFSNLDSQDSMFQESRDNLLSLKTALIGLEETKTELEAKEKEISENIVKLRKLGSEYAPDIENLEAIQQETTIEIAKVEDSINNLVASLKELLMSDENSQVLMGELYRIQETFNKIDETFKEYIPQASELINSLQEYSILIESLTRSIGDFTTTIEEVALATNAGSPIDFIDSTIETIDKISGLISSGSSSVDSFVTQVKDGKVKINEGINLLKTAKHEISSGKSTVDEAFEKLNKNEILASIELGAATSQIQQAQQELEKSKATFEETKDQALEKADLNNIISKEKVEGILAAQNFSMPAGYISEEGVDYLVRIGDNIANVEELNDLVILDLGLEGASPVKLSDVADIFQTDNTNDVYSVINGDDGLLLQIQKQTGYATGDVSNAIKEKFDELMEEYEGLNILPLMDQGLYIDVIIDSIINNIVIGGILAIFILLIFLKDIKPTLVVAISIPISLFAAIVLMYFSNISINIISLAGLALAVGMLVDNSIVVIENIYRLRSEGMPVRLAAVEGSKQVAGALVASSLTTVCVFLPIVFTEGITRKLFVDMGLTIAFSLLASLIIALSVVPAMSAGVLQNVEEKENKTFNKFAEAYKKLINKTLDHKAIVIIVTVVLFVASIIAGFSRGTLLIPSMESTQLVVTLNTEQGTPLEETAKLSDDVINRILEIDEIDDVGAMATSLSILGFGTGSQSTNEVVMYILVDEDGKASNAELEEMILERTQDIDVNLTVNTDTMDTSALGDSGISIQVKGRDLDTLQQIAGEIASIVADVDGTIDVSDNLEDASPEFRIVVDKAKASSYNLTVVQVFSQISSKLQDARAITSIESDTSDYDILVKDNKHESLTRKDLENIKITTSNMDGSQEKVSLMEIADFEEGSSPTSIYRDSGQRYMTISADLEQGYNIGLVGNKIEEILKEYEMPDGYTYQIRGENEAIDDAMRQITLMILLAIVFIYLIMVAQFQSLLSPFIVMFTIPLAFTGGFLALYFTGNPVSIIAMIGFLLLAGIIVNNGIVLVDYINQLRLGGMKKKEAIVTAGRTRLRPILMTALTTILGLMPLALGMGQGAEVIQPMGITAVGGLIYGTILTLFVVPCLYDIFNKREYTQEELEEMNLLND